MDAPNRRGPDPEDAGVFAPKHHDALVRAAEEVSWLVGRGYPVESAVRAVGDHHQLRARARIALARIMCAPQLVEARAAKRVAVGAVRGRRVEVDAFNVIVTLEVARGGGVLFRCRDGAIRDLAGLRGSYRVMDDTAAAVAWVVDALAEAAWLQVWVDAPVSNSGRMRAMFAEAMGTRAGEVAMVRDADAAMVGCEVAVSADALVIDRAAGWCNLVGETLSAWAPAAWVVETTAG